MLYNKDKKREREVKKMTKVEITKRIEELKTQAFFINMTDHLTNDDWNLLREVENEIKELKEKLN